MGPITGGGTNLISESGARVCRTNSGWPCLGCRTCLIFEVGQPTGGEGRPYWKRVEYSESCPGGNASNPAIAGARSEGCACAKM